MISDAGIASATTTAVVHATTLAASLQVQSVGVRDDERVDPARHRGLQQVGVGDAVERAREGVEQGGRDGEAQRERDAHGRRPGQRLVLGAEMHAEDEEADRQQRDGGELGGLDERVGRQRVGREQCRRPSRRAPGCA